MSSYIDLVLVKHQGSDKKYLFQAPSWSYLDAGDKVIVDNSNNEPAEVVACHTLDGNSQEFNFICEVAGATLPLKKVIAKVRLSTFDYKDDEPENEETENDEESGT